MSKKHKPERAPESRYHGYWHDRLLNRNGQAYVDMLVMHMLGRMMAEAQS